MKKEHPVIPLSQAVETIKSAILQGQYEALKEVNQVQLAVYYAIGKFLSRNTQKGVWARVLSNKSVTNYARNYPDFEAILKRI